MDLKNVSDWSADFTLYTCVTCQSGTEVTVRKNILNTTVTVNLNNADTISLYYCVLKFLKFIQHGRYDHC